MGWSRGAIRHRFLRSVLTYRKYAPRGPRNRRRLATRLRLHATLFCTGSSVARSATASCGPSSRTGSTLRAVLGTGGASHHGSDSIRHCFTGWSGAAARAATASCGPSSRTGSTLRAVLGTGGASHHGSDSIRHCFHMEPERRDPPPLRSGASSRTGSTLRAVLGTGGASHHGSRPMRPCFRMAQRRDPSPLAAVRAHGQEVRSGRSSEPAAPRTTPRAPCIPVSAWAGRDPSPSALRAHRQEVGSARCSEPVAERDAPRTPGNPVLHGHAALFARGIRDDWGENGCVWARCFCPEGVGCAVEERFAACSEPGEQRGTKIAEKGSCDGRSVAVGEGPMSRQFALVFVAAGALAVTLIPDRGWAQQTASPPATGDNGANTMIEHNAQGELTTRDDSAGFGRKRQWAFSSDASIQVQRTTQSDRDGALTTLSLAPAADYFVLPNLSVGGSIGVYYSKTGESNGLTLHDRTPRRLQLRDLAAALGVAQAGRQLRAHRRRRAASRTSPRHHDWQQRQQRDRDQHLRAGDGAPCAALLRGPRTVSRE